MTPEERVEYCKNKIRSVTGLLHIIFPSEKKGAIDDLSKNILDELDKKKSSIESVEANGIDEFIIRNLFAPKINQQWLGTNLPKIPNITSRQPVIVQGIVEGGVLDGDIQKILIPIIDTLKKIASDEQKKSLEEIAKYCHEALVSMRKQGSIASAQKIDAKIFFNQNKVTANHIKNLLAINPEECRDDSLVYIRNSVYFFLTNTSILPGNAAIIKDDDIKIAVSSFETKKQNGSAELPDELYYIHLLVKDKVSDITNLADYEYSSRRVVASGTTSPSPPVADNFSEAKTSLQQLAKGLLPACVAIRQYNSEHKNDDKKLGTEELGILNQLSAFRTEICDLVTTQPNQDDLKSIIQKLEDAKNGKYDVLLDKVEFRKKNDLKANFEQCYNKLVEFQSKQKKDFTDLIEKFADSNVNNQDVKKAIDLAKKGFGRYQDEQIDDSVSSTGARTYKYKFKQQAGETEEQFHCRIAIHLKIFSTLEAVNPDSDGVVVFKSKAKDAKNTLPDFLKIPDNLKNELGFGAAVDVSGNINQLVGAFRAGVDPTTPRTQSALDLIPEMEKAIGAIRALNAGHAAGADKIDKKYIKDLAAQIKILRGLLIEDVEGKKDRQLCGLLDLEISDDDRSAKKITKQNLPNYTLDQFTRAALYLAITASDTNGKFKSKYNLSKTGGLTSTTKSKPFNPESLPKIVREALLLDFPGLCLGEVNFDAFSTVKNALIVAGNCFEDSVGEINSLEDEILSCISLPADKNRQIAFCAQLERSLGTVVNEVAQKDNVKLKPGCFQIFTKILPEAIKAFCMAQKDLVGTVDVTLKTSFEQRFGEILKQLENEEVRQKLLNKDLSYFKARHANLQSEADIDDNWIKDVENLDKGYNGCNTPMPKLVLTSGRMAELRELIDGIMAASKNSEEKDKLKQFIDKFCSEKAANQDDIDNLQETLNVLVKAVKENNVENSHVHKFVDATLKLAQDIESDQIDDVGHEVSSALVKAFEDENISDDSEQAVLKQQLFIKILLLEQREGKRGNIFQEQILRNVDPELLKIYYLVSAVVDSLVGGAEDVSGKILKLISKISELPNDYRDAIGVICIGYLNNLAAVPQHNFLHYCCQDVADEQKPAQEFLVQMARRLNHNAELSSAIKQHLVNINVASFGKNEDDVARGYKALGLSEKDRNHIKNLIALNPEITPIENIGDYAQIAKSLSELAGKYNDHEIINNIKTSPNAYIYLEILNNIKQNLGAKVDEADQVRLGEEKRQQEEQRRKDEEVGLLSGKIAEHLAGIRVITNDKPLEEIVAGCVSIIGNNVISRDEIVELINASGRQDLRIKDPNDNAKIATSLMALAKDHNVIIPISDSKNAREHCDVLEKIHNSLAAAIEKPNQLGAGDVTGVAQIAQLIEARNQVLDSFCIQPDSHQTYQALLNLSLQGKYLKDFTSYLAMQAGENDIKDLCYKVLDDFSDSAEKWFETVGGYIEIEKRLLETQKDGLGNQAFLDKLKLLEASIMEKIVEKASFEQLTAEINQLKTKVDAAQGDFYKNTLAILLSGIINDEMSLKDALAGTVLEIHTKSASDKDSSGFTENQQKLFVMFQNTGLSIDKFKKNIANLDMKDLDNHQGQVISDDSKAKLKELLELVKPPKSIEKPSAERVVVEGQDRYVQSQK